MWPCTNTFMTPVWTTAGMTYLHVNTTAKRITTLTMSSFVISRMVFQDKMGELYVFELSPSGYVCTPYRNRIHESHSTSIVLFPVESPEYEESPIKYRERVFDEVQHAISRNDQPYEPLEIIKGCISKILTDNEAYTSFVPKKYFEYPYSPSLQIVMNVLSISTNIEFEHIDNISKERIVADDFFMRKVRILEKPVEPSHQRKLTKLGSATVIRDM